MSSEGQLAVMVSVGLGYSCAVAWAYRTGVSKRLWTVTVVGILVIALLGVLAWRRQRFQDTSLNEFFALAVVPTVAVSLLIAWLRRRNVRPVILIGLGAALWVAVAFVILILSVFFEVFDSPLQRLFG